MQKFISMLFFYWCAAGYGCLLLSMHVAPVHSKLLFDSENHCKAGLLDPIWSQDASFICSRGYCADAAAMEKNGLRITGYCFWDVVNNRSNIGSKGAHVIPKKIFLTPQGYELLVERHDHTLLLHREKSTEALLPPVSLPSNCMPNYLSNNLHMFVVIQGSVTKIERIDPQFGKHSSVSEIPLTQAAPGLFTQWDACGERFVLHRGANVGVFGFSGAKDKLICLCELEPHKHLYSPQPANFDHVCLSGDGTWIALSKKGFGIRIYPVGNISHSRTIDDVRDVRCVALNHDASVLVTGDVGGYYRAWDFNTASGVWRRYQLPIEVTEYDVHVYIGEGALRVIRKIPVKDHAQAFHVQVWSCPV